MKIRTTIALTAMLLLGVFLLPAFSESEEESIFQLSTMEPLTRPVSRFSHDEHNEKAGLEENCTICHHSYDEQGKLIEDESSEGTPCADCHKEKANGNQPELIKAYHQQCKRCHEKEGKGPHACGECHIK